MINSQKILNKQLEKATGKLIFSAGLIASLSLLFMFWCLYKLYTEAYTTYIECSKTSCVVIKQDILGKETEQYKFKPFELERIELEKNLNLFGHEVYQLTLKNPLNEEEKYYLTAETPTEEHQQENLQMINQFLYTTSNPTLYMENPRNMIKFISLSASGAAALITIFLILDCIKGIRRYKKQLNSKYDAIIRGSGFY